MADSDLKVFCFLSAVEGIISLVVAFINAFCFVDPDEPQPLHQIVFMFIYFTFFFLSSIHISRMSTRGNVQLNFEATSATCGFIFFIITTIASMVDVEHDEHLQHMTEQEEFDHLFFQYNRLQSVLSLVNAAIFLKHAVFAFDALKTIPNYSRPDSEFETENPLKLNFFFKDIWLQIKPGKK